MKDKTLLGLSALIIAQHLLFLAFFPPVIEPDSIPYIELGRQLAASLSFDSTVRMPGYPAILAFFYGLFGQSQLPVIIFQHLLGLAVYFTLLALVPAGRPRRLFAAFVLCDLLYSSYQHALLPETPFAALLCFAALEYRNYAATRAARHLLACGALIAAGIFMKPVLEFFPAVVALLLLLERRPLRQKVSAAVLFLSIPLLAMGLWSWNNLVRKGTFSLLPFGSVHYVGRFVTHIEFPEGSFARETFLKRLSEYPPGATLQERRRAAAPVIADLKKEQNRSDAEINREFGRISTLSIVRHPFIYAKETLTEAFYFFFSAHNLYAKYSLKGILPVSVKEGLDNGNYSGVLLKVAVSLHPLYWLMFLLCAYFIAGNWRLLLAGEMPFLSFACAAIFYITALSTMINEGLSRYRMPLQPFMIFMAALALDGLLAAREKNRGGRPG